MQRLKDIKEFEVYQKLQIQSINKKRKRIRICMTGCRAFGAEEVKDALSKEIENQGVETEIVETGCHLFCSRAPVLVVEPDEIFYQQVSPSDAKDIISKTLKDGKIIPHLLYKEPNTGKLEKRQEDIEFYKRQKKIVLRNCGKIDPTKIIEYISRGGYSALIKVLKMIPEDVIDEVKKSKLRGRGGAGFPTSIKWELARKQKGDKKYIVCNADEGDPGAFMDRAVLEGDPHSVIEGMLIGAYSIGADEGYIYVRAEYPIAVKHLNIAIKQCEELGLLRENILGCDFNFNIHIKEGAGAFVCGEETALIASIEGKRGMPRPRPPFPVECGIWGKPTSINNVETFANINSIILSGYDDYAKIGTERSGGTKVFSLAGKINNTGLVEVPIGTQLGEVIYNIGGGIPKGREFKAVQTGGPSGGCIPTKFLNIPIDYESLTAIGSIMGSGGMIVVDENTCMVELVRYFLSFTQSESCGKCTPCRIGTKRMLEILTRITEGKGEDGDIEKLIELGNIIKDTSLCGLGQTAPNPVLSTIKYFRDEYEEHIKRKYCSSAQCKELITAPCNNTCPGGIDVSGYIQLIREEKFLDAYNLIKESIPFPSICGRVCYHPCETKCKRGEIDEPVAINDLKRFVSDYAMKRLKIKDSRLKIKDSNDKKVAIIGSGPAGLTCAYNLAKESYAVTIFEKENKLGGMLRYGIPEYRLPKKILDREIENTLIDGIEVKKNKSLEKNFTIEQLLNDGYKAVFLAVGASISQKLKIEGENISGVFNGIDFLNKVNSGEKINIGEKVLVIGGGNVAIDSARVAKRLGVKEVTVAYRRTKEEMPAHIWEINEAEREWINFEFLAKPVRIFGNGKVEGMEFIKTKIVGFDDYGRRKPVDIEGSNFLIKANSIIVAIGQVSTLRELIPDIKIDNDTLTTNIKGVFAGGDCATGPDMVISAIGQGKRAAKSIMSYLQGKEIKLEEYKKKIISEEEYKKKEEASDVERQKPKCINKDLRESFEEVEKGLNKKQAIKEVKRCLQCHLER